MTIAIGDAHCMLYTFALQSPFDGPGIHLVKVARLTNGVPKDWDSWPDRYREEEHDELRLLEIASIEFVDDRDAPAPKPSPS